MIGKIAQCRHVSSKINGFGLPSGRKASGCPLGASLKRDCLSKCQKYCVSDVGQRVSNRRCRTARSKQNMFQNGPISNSNSCNSHRFVHKREPNRAEARDEKKRLGSPKSAISVPKIPERIPRCAKSLKTGAGTVRVMSQSGRVAPPKMDVGSHPMSSSRTNRTLPNQLFCKL